MPMQLPSDLERSLQAAVRDGHFPSLDDAMAEAARLLLREIQRGQFPPGPGGRISSDDPVLGCMKQDAELMDGIVADAYRLRQEDNWREIGI